MRAEKIRKLLNTLDCQACGRHAEIPTKGICALDCATEYRLDDEIEKELLELESKAAKWDMIQWAIDKQVEFVAHNEGVGLFIEKIDLVTLEQLYKEREQVE